MMKAIPPIVSDRGSWPHVLAGDFGEGGRGRILPIPDWMTFKTTTLPSELEVEPWYEAVCTLWDNRALYHSVATRARRIAEDGIAKKPRATDMSTTSPH
jgi:hypothetical protein